MHVNQRPIRVNFVIDPNWNCHSVNRTLRMVSTLATVHTFCESRDTQETFIWVVPTNRDIFVWFRTMGKKQNLERKREKEKKKIGGNQR